MSVCHQFVINLLLKIIYLKGFATSSSSSVKAYLCINIGRRSQNQNILMFLTKCHSLKVQRWLANENFARPRQHGPFAKNIVYLPYIFLAHRYQLATGITMTSKISGKENFDVVNLNDKA